MTYPPALPPAFYERLKLWAARGFVDIGFTGTQRGMSPAQVGSFTTVARYLHENVPVWRFHHGDCIGADAEAHDIARALGAVIIIHPGTASPTGRFPVTPSPLGGSLIVTKEPKRAYCIGGHETRPAWPYLLRNEDIVKESDLLIATPYTLQEQLRSGTWATVRYARRTGKSLMVVAP